MRKLVHVCVFGWFSQMLADTLKISGFLEREQMRTEIPCMEHCLTAPHHWYGAVLEYEQWLKSINKYDTMTRW